MTEDKDLTRVDLSDGSTLLRTASADVAFPHVCAGMKCAVCAWVAYRMTGNGFALYHAFVYGKRGESARY